MTESIGNSLSINNDESVIDDDELNKFTSTLDEFTPVIPETVTKFYMRQCGLQTEDDRLVKLLSVSVQKFMSDIINDCHQLHKLREKSSNRPAAAAATTTAAPAPAPATTTPIASANAQSSTAEATVSTTEQLANAVNSKKPISSTNQTLTLNDLTHVLDEYGINVKKTFYYT
ncbi:hypothetical protein I4U23_001810 [Adineta vaga]|nr:hypothetical protein I4U23_001810 [Adineta vaga]